MFMYCQCLQKRREKKLEIFKRAEKYAREYSIKQRDEICMARQARKHGNFYVPPAPKLAFVVRIRGYFNFLYWLLFVVWFVWCFWHICYVKVLWRIEWNTIRIVDVLMYCFQLMQHRCAHFCAQWYIAVLQVS